MLAKFCTNSKSKTSQTLLLVLPLPLPALALLQLILQFHHKRGRGMTIWHYSKFIYPRDFVLKMVIPCAVHRAFVCLLFRDSTFCKLLVDRAFVDISRLDVCAHLQLQPAEYWCEHTGNSRAQHNSITVRYLREIQGASDRYKLSVNYLWPEQCVQSSAKRNWKGDLPLSFFICKTARQ